MQHSIVKLFTTAQPQRLRNKHIYSMVKRHIRRATRFFTDCKLYVLSKLHCHFPLNGVAYCYWAGCDDARHTRKKGMSSSVPPADSMANNANVNFSQFKSYVVLYTITQCTVDKS